MRHLFLINKKIPISKYRIAAKLAVGFVWTSGKNIPAL